eukprot:5599430-Alexandrium_andersonii.AAC.1
MYSPRLAGMSTALAHCHSPDTELQHRPSLSYEPPTPTDAHLTHPSKPHAGPPKSPTKPPAQR